MGHAVKRVLLNIYLIKMLMKSDDISPYFIELSNTDISRKRDNKSNKNLLLNVSVFMSLMIISLVNLSLLILLNISTEFS